MSGMTEGLSEKDVLTEAEEGDRRRSGGRSKRRSPSLSPQVAKCDVLLVPALALQSKDCYNQIYPLTMFPKQLEKHTSCDSRNS